MNNVDKTTDSPQGMPIPIGATHALVPQQRQVLALPQDAGHDGAGDDTSDLREYWDIILKRRWSVLGFLGIVFMVVLVATLLTPSTYRASTTLQIERDTIQIVKVEGFVPIESPGDKDFYQTQYELLKSESLAGRVIAQLDLANSATVKRLRQPSPLARLVGMLKAGDSTSNGQDMEKAALLRWFQGGLTIEPVRNSRLVRVQFTSRDPAFSATIVNAMAEGFIASNLERRMDATSYARSFLEDRLQQLKVKLEDSEKELVVFAQKEQIVNVDDKQSLIAQQLQAISTALSGAQKDRIEAEADYRQLQGRGGDASPQVLKSDLVSKLKEKGAELNADYQDKLQILKPDFPTMQRLHSQIGEIDRQISGEVARIKGSVKSSYDAALVKEKMLQQRVVDLTAQVLDLQSRSIKYNILRRDADTNRQLYDGLLQRYKEIGVAGGVGTNNISVVDRATPPTSRYAPRLGLNLSLAILLGLFGGVLLAFLFEYLDDTIKTPEDVERQFGLPLLGIIPKTTKGPPLANLDNPRSAFAEAYRSVRTALQFATDKGVPRTLLVTSCGKGEGKSTTVASLAQNFAQLGKRVLVIDADLRNPSMHRLFGIDGSVGLTNYLAGDARPLSMLKPTKTRLLICLCAGPIPPDPAELLAGPKMLSLLSLVGESFDQVIIDGPPVMGIADALLLGNIADGTVLAVESGATRRGYVRGVLRRLLSARVRPLGVVLTKYDARVAGYGQGYGYGYGYGADLTYGEAAKRLEATLPR